ncbi:MAG: 3'-5' exonuclease [Oligoflexales bacterium]|nr:3'-5' exonuclease [Oligoflexales bacterium]
MPSQLDYSIFKEVLFPKLQERDESEDQAFAFRRSRRYRVHPDLCFREHPLVVFDIETTGLDSASDRIIEIGAQKFVDFAVTEEYSSLVKTSVILSDESQRLTGLKPEMFVDMPTIDLVLPQFLKFIEGSILVAHNANFDLSFIKAECSRQSIDLEWPTFCTLKLAQEYLVSLKRKNLDSLAEHYGLSFEARHRSIGDVKVTAAVLKNLLIKEARSLMTWKDLKPFQV